MIDTNSALPEFTATRKNDITGYATAIKLKFDSGEVKLLAKAITSVGRLNGSVANQEGTIKKLKTARLDRQSNTSAKAANLQIQVSDTNANHTTIWTSPCIPSSLQSSQWPSRTTSCA